MFGPPLWTIVFFLFYTINTGTLMAGMFQVLPQATVTGTITDIDGLSLSGVHVQVESTETGTISNLDGFFEIQAEADDVLLFSIVGYKALSLTIRGRQHINVILERDVTQLGEVILNAGYYSVKERERTGNIATIKAVTMEKQPVGNPLAAMQGHLSGVDIVQATGVPGGGYEIEIRGRNFINGVTDPLFLVDGVPYISETLGSIDVSGGILAGNINPLNAINPNDIESIEVLKDADATAIYGSRGANGVVLITTKRGKAGKTRFNAHLSTTMGQVSNFLELLDTQQYLEVRREGVINDGFGALLDDPTFDYVWPDLKSWDLNRYTDWQKELIGGTAYRNNAQVSISGGSEATRFLISGSHQKETTVFPGDANYKKSSIHSTLNHSSGNGRFGIDLSTGFTRENNNLPRTDFTNKAFTIEPNAPRLYDDQANLNWENNTWDNPLASLEETFEMTANTLFTNAVVSYSILPNLELKSSFGFNSYRLESQRLLPSTARNPKFGLTPESYSSQTSNASKRESWIVEPQLNWKKQWKDFKMEFLLGTTFQQQSAQQLVQRGRGFPNNSLIHNLAAASTVEVLEDSESEYNYNAIFGRINLNLFDRYILNLTGRRDGSSRFGTGRQFGNFGAVGLAWLFSEEPIFGEGAILSFGKLRGSYGITGSDNIGDYRFLDTYSVPGFDYDGITILEPTGIFNPLFGWEENKKLEVGLELGFFDDRLMLNASWYRNRSSNQLVGIPLAATTGFSELTGNFDATVENSGIELDLRALIFKSKKFEWSTTFNLTVPKNKLVEFDGLETSTFANRYVIGKPLTIVKLYHSLGVDPETGIYRFEDYDNDGAISSPQDNQWIEDFTPKFYGGFGNSLDFGNLSLNIFLQFKKQKSYNEMRFGSTLGGRRNAIATLFDRWEQPGDIKPFARATAGLSGSSTGGLQSSSNAAVSDASYIRLRNVTLNYKLPRLKNDLEVNVYLQGQNLLTFTNYTGPDPEQPSSTRLSPLRQITLGLQLGF